MAQCRVVDKCERWDSNLDLCYLSLYICYHSAWLLLCSSLARQLPDLERKGLGQLKFNIGIGATDKSWLTRSLGSSLRKEALSCARPPLLVSRSWS